MTVKPRVQLPDSFRMQELFERHLGDLDLAALIEDYDLLSEAGHLPRAVWEAPAGPARTC